MDKTDSVLRPETRALLLPALRSMMNDIASKDDGHHLKETPERVLKAWEEMFSGLLKDPAEVLRLGFEEDCYDQMIHIKDIPFVSTCAHHLAFFHGRVHFAYLPDKRVVGLSKVPRMVEILARRPQIQERLTQQIVHTFQQVVKPLGCGAMIEGWHGCVGARGVRKPEVKMVTTALSGFFIDKPSVKEEFLLTMGVTTK